MPFPLRRFVLAAALLAALLLPGVTVAQAESPATPPAPLRALEFGPFEEALASLTPERRAELDGSVIEATIAELGAAMASGELTSAELTTYYLARTRDLDVGGLQSMNELNPEALAMARALDSERAVGNVRGPLHGIPISLKDNIGTGDLMHTTAGAAAMADSRSDRDAFVAARLREAGAVILGKANMSEWAAFMQMPGQPAGFSALGGQVVNPYSHELSPLGSSAGSAVGTSANLVAASVGTETMGSIIAPAAVNGVVGIKPSLGLVSRDRIIPITDQTDTPGVLARTVADAATVLSAIIGVDEDDPATVAAADLAGTDLTGRLDVNALQGVRVGFHTDAAAPPEGMSEAEFIDFVGFGPAIEGLEAAGAEVEVIWAGSLDNMNDFVALGTVGLAKGVADYLAATAPEDGLTSIADVVAFNGVDLERYAPYGQSMLEAAAALPEVPDADYQAAGAELRDAARAYLDDLVAANDIDLLASRDNRLANAYAIAGYPAITVPAGSSQSGGRRGLTLVGGLLEDAELLSYAYAFEAATGLRELPPVD